MKIEKLESGKYTAYRLYNEDHLVATIQTQPSYINGIQLYVVTDNLHKKKDSLFPETIMLYKDVIRTLREHFTEEEIMYIDMSILQ